MMKGPLNDIFSEVKEKVLLVTQDINRQAKPTKEAVQEKFEKVKNQNNFLKSFTQTQLFLLVLFIVGVLGSSFFAYKDAGETYYNGYYYTAGSLFAPDKYAVSGLTSSVDRSLYGDKDENVSSFLNLSGARGILWLSTLSRWRV